MTLATRLDPRIARSMPFLEYLVEWEENLPGRSIAAVIEEAGGPERVALVSVDLIKGFALSGPLSSPRVAAIVPPVVRLVQRAHALGVRHFVFLQDAHPQDSPEFGEFPPHCVRGTEEAEMVDDLAALPFSECFTVLEKTSIDSAVGTGLPQWLDAHPEIRRIVAVGDCTDLCLYEMVMHLQMRSHVHRHDYEVVVPANCADTYDLPVDLARGLDARPHDGDLMHRMFLYQMAANGVMVVANLDA